MTLRLLIAYNGARFRGWQRGNGRTVQATLEEALQAALAEVGRKSRDEADPTIAGAGRTDAGAHAEGQVASVVVPADVDPGVLLESLNRALPPDVAVLSADRADDRFHARHRATGKTYRYRIVDGPVSNPFLAHLSWRSHEPLDVEAMRAAAGPLVGRHDFSAFTSDKSKKSRVRSISAITVVRASYSAGPVLEIAVSGDGFLWKQVRVIVACLVAAGRGEADAGLVVRMLESGDRSLAPPPAPASGLTLVSVAYDG